MAGAVTVATDAPSALLRLVENPWIIAAGLLLLFAIVCALSRLASGVSEPVARETLHQSGSMLKAANRAAAHAEQDGNPIMALRHVTAAKTFLETLRGVLSDDQIQQGHQVDAAALARRFDDLEQTVMKRINEQAPDLMPEGEFAVRAGWLS